MKNSIVLLFICICSIGYGQVEKVKQLDHFDKKNIRYGFYLGLHSKGYQMTASNATMNSGAGFQLGVLADLRVSNYVSVITEPGIISTSNTLTLAGKDIQMPTTYFHLPVSLKLQTKRINNTRGFISGGLSYNYNFAANQNNLDNGADPRDFELKRNTVMGEIAFGASFYFYYFKFTPSIRGIYGFQNEFIGLGSIAKNSLSSLKTRGIFLTLTFQ